MKWEKKRKNLLNDGISIDENLCAKMKQKKEGKKILWIYVDIRTFTLFEHLDNESSWRLK